MFGFYVSEDIAPVCSYIFLAFASFFYLDMHFSVNAIISLAAFLLVKDFTFLGLLVSTFI